jgi:glycerophosphoryl diester phosphodiesterase
MSAPVERLEEIDVAVQRAAQDFSLRELHFHALPAVYRQELEEQEGAVSQRASGPGCSVGVAVSGVPAEAAARKLARDTRADILLRVTLGEPRIGSFQAISLRRQRLRTNSELEVFQWLERRLEGQGHGVADPSTGSAADRGALLFRITGPEGVQHVFTGWSNDWIQCTAVFHANFFDDLDMLVDVLWNPPENGTSGGQATSTSQFIGRAAIMASELVEMKGVLQRPLVNDAHSVIGEFRCEYCVIKPYAGTLPPRMAQLRFSLNEGINERKKIQLIGHRGAGSQKTRSRVQENTVLSFLTAIRKGLVDAIELDVQLTRDQVPVIYHDFFIRCVDEDDVDESDDERFRTAWSASPVRSDRGARLNESMLNGSRVLTRSSRTPDDSAEDVHCTCETANLEYASERDSCRASAVLANSTHHVAAADATAPPSTNTLTNASTSDQPHCLRDHARASGKANQPKSRRYGTPIYSLTYEEFKSACRSMPRSRSRGGNLRVHGTTPQREPRWSDEWSDFTRVASSDGNLGYLVRHFSESSERTDDANPIAMIRDNALPSLRRVLDRVPEEITLLVEIKYPTPELMRETSLPYPERNHFIDRVLEVIFQKGSLKRRIVFLSFDPDVCLMVRKKQAIYPVCFLNAAGRSAMSEHSDPRALSVANGIAFAVWAGLDGMVLLCDLIFEEPGIVEIIHSAGLKVYCYGSSTAEPHYCEQLIHWGVDGIIADRVGYIARALNPLFMANANPETIETA